MADLAAVLRTGWLRAASSAAVVLAVTYLMTLLLAWLQDQVTPQAIPIDGRPVENPIAAPSIPRAAVFALMFWHGVSYDVGISIPAGDIPFGTSLEVAISLTLTLGLAVSAYLLYRVGKRFTGPAGPGGWLGGIRGLQVGLFYGTFMLALSFLAGLDIDLAAFVPADESGAPDAISVHPSRIGAFTMPFLLALLATGVGAMSRAVWPAARQVRVALAAVAGGWRGAWLLTYLSSVGFLIVAANHPEVTRGFLDALPGGATATAFMAVSALMVVPNLGAGIAAASMGGSINLVFGHQACAVVSYFQFPAPNAPAASELAGAGPCGLPLPLDAAPAPYLLFLLAPVAATIAGGWLAAQRAGARRAGEGALAGVSIALPYALSLWVFGLVARFGYDAGAGFIPFAFEVWIGPGLLFTILVALLWGAGGGAIGGVLGARYGNGPGIAPGPSENALD